MPGLPDLLKMRAYFESGATRPQAFRRQQLKKLRDAVKEYAGAFEAALYTDLKKSPEETWATETGFLLSGINNQLKHLSTWMEPVTVPTNLLNLPSKSFILPEPLGVVLIIGPWNYPLQLLFTPLAGAMAAGNCVVLKASEFAPATAAVMQELIEKNFSKEYILFTDEEGQTVIPRMMENFRFDHVFYTGSTTVGRIIYKMAADKLVPVTLELGGKSPCIVEADANIKVAAKRIAMSKFSNAGQMCVAPDYVLVHASKKEALIAAFKEALQQFFGADAETSGEFGKIINEKQFDRLVQYLQQGNILVGGGHNRERLHIAPTILDNISLDAPVMQEEIFGPVLPILTFETAEDAKKIIAANPNPLAFYVFTSDNNKEKQWLNDVPFGGGCVNNTAIHLLNHNLPFGGRGASGSGAYHGKYTFDTFSHQKSILRSPTWFDPVMKYPPFKGKLKILKWLIK